MSAKGPTYFELLSVEPKYHLAAGELERKYHAAAKEHHPDRHVRDESRARVASALHTAELTKAYRTLKDPVKRAEYLLELEGIAISDEKGGHKVAPAFLVEIMELREALEEAKAAKDGRRIGELGDAMRAREDEALVAIANLFSAWEQGERGVLGAIADALVALRYYRRFLDEVDAGDEAHGEM